MEQPAGRLHRLRCLGQSLQLWTASHGSQPASPDTIPPESAQNRFPGLITLTPARRLPFLSEQPFFLPHLRQLHCHLNGGGGGRMYPAAETAASKWFAAAEIFFFFKEKLLNNFEQS